MAKIFRSDGTSENLDPLNGSKYISLKQMQEVVGGYIEEIRVPNSFNYLIVNEDGRMKKLPLNEKASTFAQRPIVGDAILISEIELEK
jgi:hypothetical protein